MVEYKHQTFRKVLLINQLIAECLILLFLSNFHMSRCIFTSQIRYSMSHLFLKLKNQVPISPNIPSSELLEILTVLSLLILNQSFNEGNHHRGLSQSKHCKCSLQQTESHPTATSSTIKSMRQDDESNSRWWDLLSNGKTLKVKCPWKVTPTLFKTIVLKRPSMLRII